MNCLIVNYEKDFIVHIVIVSKEKLLQMKIAFTCLLMLIIAVSNAQLKVGDAAPEISLPDAKGNTLTLSSLKGKVVLVDFWASWCGPCRMSNPRVVKLYEKYKGKGFEVFAVSIDSKKKDWLKAVKQDKITYTQVNDKDGWEAASAAKYKVEEIPTTFLLDKNGVIVAVDLEGKALEEKLKELL